MGGDGCATLSNSTTVWASSAQPILIKPSTLPAEQLNGEMLDQSTLPIKELAKVMFGSNPAGQSLRFSITVNPSTGPDGPGPPPTGNQGDAQLDSTSGEEIKPAAAVNDTPATLNNPSTPPPLPRPIRPSPSRRANPLRTP